MSRSDYPPGYDNSHGPMYPPQGGGYPPPPSYGFPSYGGPQPGQPFAPYPSGPNAPLFPGQPTGYPAAPYPGQPQPAGPPGSGYPAPPPMPPVMPPTIPSGVLSSDEEFAASGSNWDDMSIRHAFIRKVYMILASQLLVTTAIVAIFTFVSPVRDFVRKNQAVYWASYAVYFITHIVLVCCKGPRRKFPWNVILLLIFLLQHKSCVSGSRDHCCCVHRCHSLLFPDKGGFHKVPGPLLRPRDCYVCDRHHHSHRAFLQIYLLASHAVRGDRRHSVHSVPGISHSAPDRKQEVLHQSGGVRLRRAVPLRRHRPDLPVPAADYRILHQMRLSDPDGRWKGIRCFFLCYNFYFFFFLGGGA
uniref:Transmembrane BAX inhibitor motif containing 1a n=1 Tax=Xiphophorus maculatus TaxID=8083 RepID=A0A3B5Q792_XIPMA